MVCLDTTFFADLFRKNPAAQEILEKLSSGNESLSTTIMTIAELYYGAYKSSRIKEEKDKVQEILNHFSILYMDELGAEKFGEIMNSMEREGQKAPDIDVLIGAISISKGENTLVTRNKKDFENIPGLKIITY